GDIGKDLTDPNVVLAAGQTYFVLAASGDLTAASITLHGDFFFIVTPGHVQLQVNASLAIAGISLTAHGFLDMDSAGAAGILWISSSVSLPGITITNATLLVA